MGNIGARRPKNKIKNVILFRLIEGVGANSTYPSYALNTKEY
jgi:hypothetical protein